MLFRAISIEERSKMMTSWKQEHLNINHDEYTGAEFLEIASLSGHKSIQTTMRYTHTDNKRLASVISKTFDVFGSDC